MAELLKNLYNPVPIHDSKDRWYDSRRTYKGVHSHVYAEKGILLATQFIMKDASTVNYPMLPTKLQMEVYDGLIGVPNTIVTFSRTFIREDTTFDGEHCILMRMRLDEHEGMDVYLTHTGWWAENYPSAGRYKIGDKDHRLDKNILFKSAYQNTIDSIYRYEQTLGRFVQYEGNVVVSCKNIFHCYVRSCTNEDYVIISGLEGDVSVTKLHGGAYGYSYADFYVSFNESNVGILNEVTNEPIVDGLYHLEFVELYSGVCFGYSEPFAWTSDVSRFISVSCSSLNPMIINGEELKFINSGTRFYYHYYIDAYIMMPPFQFDAEVDEIDGFKYPKKLVSYKQGTFEFLATGYFAECIRMLWHCDYKVFRQDGEKYDIDYLEPPEISWDEDSHLCTIKLTFNSDTYGAIMQTNGLSLSQVEKSGAYRINAYDNSHDNN